MPHAYTEDQVVEQPGIGLFAELGWTTVSALEETFGATGTLLRDTKGEVLLVSRLRAPLECGSRSHLNIEHLFRGIGQGPPNCLSGGYVRLNARSGESVTAP